MAMHIACPHCAAKLAFEDTSAGAMVRCRECNRPFMLPVTQGAAAAWGFQNQAPASPATDAWQSTPPPPGEWAPPHLRRDYQYPPPSNALPWILAGVLAFILIVIVGGAMVFWVSDIAPDVFDDPIAPDAVQFNFPDNGVPGVEPANETPIDLKLKDGRADANNQLNNGDPLDPRQGQPRKLYIVELQANRRYVIDMNSDPLDCFLRVEDKDRQQLAFDDDGGAGLNSRLTFVPARTDRYRIIATCLSGRGPFRLSIREE